MNRETLPYWITTGLFCLVMNLRNLTMGFIMPHRLAMKSEATLERWAREGREDPKRAREVARWRDYAQNGIPVKTAQASVDAHREVFEDLEERLASSSWLMGDRLSVLDVSWFITTRRLRNAGYALERHPRLAAWHARLEERPAFAAETRDPAILRAFLPLDRAYRRITGTRLTDLTS